MLPGVRLFALLHSLRPVENYDLNPALPSGVAPVEAQLAKARRRAVRGIWCGMFCAVRGTHRFQSLAS